MLVTELPRLRSLGQNKVQGQFPTGETPSQLQVGSYLYKHPYVCFLCLANFQVQLVLSHQHPAFPVEAVKRASACSDFPGY